MTPQQLYALYLPTFGPERIAETIQHIAYCDANGMLEEKQQYMRQLKQLEAK